MRGHGPVSTYGELFILSFIEKSFKISANLYAILFRATLGPSTGTADERHSSQRSVPERKNWPSKTGTIGCTRLQLDTKARSKETNKRMIRWYMYEKRMKNQATYSLVLCRVSSKGISSTCHCFLMRHFLSYQHHLEERSRRFVICYQSHQVPFVGLVLGASRVDRVHRHEA
jgi:hypothetical protein